jgi:glutathione S-transferase
MSYGAAQLIVFPPSVDSETARWILAHHGRTYRETRRSAVGSAVTAALRFAKIPILLENGTTLSTARPIADRLDQDAASEHRLVPDDRALAAEVDRLWAEFNGGMGVWIAQWVYYYVLRDRALAIRLMTYDVPSWQARLDRVLHPFVAWMMRRGLGKLDRTIAMEALQRCQGAFDEVERCLRDGRPYVTGDRFTLADVAFCACAGPLMLADSYGGAIPELIDVPEEMRREVLRFREHEAGQFALRLYATHYRPRAGACPSSVPERRR